MAEDITAVVDSPSVPPTPATEQPLAFSTAALMEEAGTAASAASMPGVPDDSLTEYGFDDESVRQYDIEKYLARKDVTDRIGLLALPYGARVHFKGGIGYFRCFSVWKKKIVQNQPIEVCERRAACCVHAENPRKRFVAPIIIYGTRPDGKLLENFTYVLKAWIYSDDKYIAMRTVHSQFPLLEHDLLVTCSEEKYQKITLAPCKAALWKSPNLPEQVRTDIKTWVEGQRVKLGRMLGKTLSETEFLQRIGLAPAPTAVAPGLDAPLIDVKGLLD